MVHIEPRRPTVKNPPEQFAGDVWVQSIVTPHEDGQHATAPLVRVAPGARTAWHSHEKGQYLHVTQGTARFGTRDGQVIEVHPGQTLYTPPGQEHWQAATEDELMEHIAFLELGEDPPTATTWKEHVTDDDLNGATHQQHDHSHDHADGAAERPSHLEISGSGGARTSANAIPTVRNRSRIPHPRVAKEKRRRLSHAVGFLLLASTSPYPVTQALQVHTVPPCPPEPTEPLRAVVHRC